MSLIQIRNVPEEVHRKAKARAALRGQTLSDFALQALEKELRTPTMAEITARVREAGSVDSEVPASQIIREERDAR